MSVCLHSPTLPSLFSSAPNLRSLFVSLGNQLFSSRLYLFSLPLCALSFELPFQEILLLNLSLHFCEQVIFTVSWGVSFSVSVAACQALFPFLPHPPSLAFLSFPLLGASCFILLSLYTALPLIFSSSSALFPVAFSPILPFL